MTTNNNSDNSDNSDNGDKAISAFLGKIQDDLNILKSDTKKITEDFENKTKNKVDDSLDDNFLDWLKDDEDKKMENKKDTTFTKEDILMIVKETTEKVKSNLKKEFDEERAQESAAQSAFREALEADEIVAVGYLPELKDNNSEIYKLVSEEVLKIKKKDPANKQMISLAALRIKSKLIDENKYLPESVRNSTGVTLTSHGAYSMTGGTPTKFSLGPKERQLASALGITPERVMQLNEKYGKKH